MPNPYHFRAKIDRLWRRSADHNPGYIRLKALSTIIREVFAPTERARLNQELYFATNPYDVARHHLRDLYDRADALQTSPLGGACPALDAGGAPHSCGAEGASPDRCGEEESPEEDDDPL